MTDLLHIPSTSQSHDVTDAYWLDITPPSPPVSPTISMTPPPQQPPLFDLSDTSDANRSEWLMDIMDMQSIRSITLDDVLREREDMLESAQSKTQQQPEKQSQPLQSLSLQIPNNPSPVSLDPRQNSPTSTSLLDLSLLTPSPSSISVSPTPRHSKANPRSGVEKPVSRPHLTPRRRDEDRRRRRVRERRVPKTDDAVEVKDQCVRCSVKATDTPMMRKGPDGCRSLCNACGLKWSRHGVL